MVQRLKGLIIQILGFSFIFSFSINLLARSSSDFLQDYNLGVKTAQKTKKIILLDFTARWCPGCVRYDSDVFSKKKFKNLTKDMIKIKIDIDLDKNAKILEKYDVKEIPTLIFLTSESDLIERLVDYQPKEKLEVVINSIVKDPISIIKLEAEIDLNNPNSILRVARKYFSLKNFERADFYFEKLENKPKEFWPNKIEFVRNDNQKLKKVLVQAISSEPESSRSVGWRIQLIQALNSELKDTNQNSPKKEVEIYKNEITQWFNKAKNNENYFKQSIKDEELGEFIGFEKFLYYSYWADFIDVTEIEDQKNTKLQQVWKEATQWGLAHKIKPETKGPAVRLLIFMTESGDLPMAKNWALKMMKADPENLDVIRRYVKILYKMKDYKTAEKVGLKNLKDFEGRNYFWLAETIVRSQIELNKTKEAKKIVDDILSREELKASNFKKINETYRELAAKLPSEKI